MDELLKVNNNVWCSKNKGLSLQCLRYYIIDKDECAIVDWGDSRVKKSHIMKDLSSLGVSYDNLKFIFITHHHDDHSGGLISGGINRTDGKFVTSYRSSPHECSHIFNRDTLFLDHTALFYNIESEDLKIGDMYFNILRVPYHSDDSACLYGNKMLFSGDNIFLRGKGLGNPNYEHRLYELTKLDFNYLMPGHHQPGKVSERNIENILKKDAFSEELIERQFKHMNMI